MGSANGRDGGLTYFVCVCVCCGCEWTRGGERSEKRRERREHDGMEEAEEWEAESGN